MTSSREMGITRPRANAAPPNKSAAETLQMRRVNAEEGEARRKKRPAEGESQSDERTAAKSSASRMRTSMRTSRKKRRRRRRTLLIIFAVLLLLIAIGVILFYALKKGEEAQAAAIERETLAETGILPTMTQEEIQARLDAIVEEGMFNASMNGIVHFPSGGGDGDVQIENIEANHYSCTVEIYLANSDECILKTGLIAPGQYVAKMPLDRQLRDGAFDCTAVFTAYDDNVQPVGKVNMDIVVLVGI